MASDLPIRCDSVLDADEPLSSWSRARWVPAAKKLGKDAFADALMNGKLSLEQHIRAVEILTELFGGVPFDLAHKLCVNNDKTDPELIARIVWSLSRTGETAEPWKIIMAATHSKDPRPARAAWEALSGMPASVKEKINVNWNRGLTSHDRRVRAAVIQVAKRQGRESYHESFADWFRPEFEIFLADLWIDGVVKFASGGAEYCAEAVNAKKLEARLRLEAVRLLQLALGDVAIENGPATKPFWGYEAVNTAPIAPKLRREIAPKLAKAFPTGDEHLNQELARLLGMLGEDVPGLLNLVAGRWTKDSPVSSDIHYLICLAKIPGKRDMEVSLRTATALNGIQVKLAAQGARLADQVPGILEAVFEKLQELDPNLAAALVNDPTFGHPGHALWASKLPLEQKQIATRKLLARIGKLNAEDAQLAWNPDLVRLVGSLPDEEALPILRARFADPRLSDTVALLLAAKHQVLDRGRLVEAVGSLQPAVAQAAAEALIKLPGEVGAKPAEIGRAIRALRRVEGQKNEVKSHAALARLIMHWTKQELKPSADGLAATWADWFARKYPDEAVISGPAGTDSKAWKKRLDAVAWDKGDIRRGEAVFQRRNCFACHGASRRLGPELTGIAQRFSRDDLFTAILDPSKDISPAFVATQIATTTGKVYNGMLIYESEQLYLLQTTPDVTVRISGEEVLTVQPSTISFMPTGLLDDMKDADLADLYAYLTSLRKK